MKSPLILLGLCALSAPALAELPRDASVERLSPTRIAVTWSGYLVPKERFELGLTDAQGHPLAHTAVRSNVSGAAGRADFEHAADLRPYVQLRDAEGASELLGERVLPLEGGINFRDLGGYPTRDGRQVRWGMLFRSGAMDGLTEHDHAYLQRLGIKTICDLRTGQERAAAPTPRDRFAPSATYLSWDYENNFDVAALKQAFAQGIDPSEAAMRVMASFYRTMPAQFAPRFRAAFDALKAGDGLLFNCSAGKDRTGLLAALVLTALGVQQDVVVADYAMSQRVPSLQKLRQRSNDPTGHKPADPNAAFLAQLPPTAVNALMGTDPMYLSAAFDQIRHDYGSLDAYLERALGVSAADRAALQARYLEPRPK